MFALATPLSLAVWFILLFPISNLSTISNLFCSIFVPFLFLCRMKYVNFSYKLFISHFFRDYKCVLQIDYTFFCSLKLNSIKEIPWHHIFQVLELFIVRSQILLYRTDVKPDFIFFADIAYALVSVSLPFSHTTLYESPTAKPNSLSHLPFSMIVGVG